MRFGVGVAGVLGVALLLAPLARAADQTKIDAAVSAAARYIKQQQAADGSWPIRASNAPDPSMGATALCGLALVEAGKDAGVEPYPNDPAVVKAADYVRQASLTATGTYSLSLGIMFLDRLGDPADAELIESMAVRLMAGQDGTTGGWYYSCPKLSGEEIARLRTALGGRAKLVAGNPPPQWDPKNHKGAENLSPEIKQQLGQAAGGSHFGAGDNSNSQFAILALWIARRQGIPVEGALTLIDRRFRSMQAADGGWPYGGAMRGGPMMGPPGGLTPRMPMAGAMGGGGSTPAMTCAGLLGLALSHGGAIEATLKASTKLPGKTGTAPRKGPPAIEKDSVVANGLRCLGEYVKMPLDTLASQSQSGPAGVGAPPGAAAMMGRSGGKIYYYLFSLERVAVAYALPTIGGVDWYEKGVEFLLKNGPPWRGEFESEEGNCCDTCFSVLFLRRANLVPDLSDDLRGKIQDVRLRAGDLNELKNRPDNRPGAGTGRGDTAPSGGGAAPGVTPEYVPQVSPEVAKLAALVIDSAPEKQEELIEKLRDTKGDANCTDALAYAIHKLDGPAKKKAREALSDRLKRFTSKTITEKLGDDDPEVRRAAALAVAMKPDKANVPKVIELLGDKEVVVRLAAHAALKDLTGQELGSGPDTIPAWKKWWSENGEK